MSFPNLPSPGRSSFGASVVDGSLYVVGGHMNQTHHYASDNITAQVDVFVLSEKKWLPSPALPPRPNATQGFVLVNYKNYLYALGGLVHHEYEPHQNPEKTYESIADVDRFDLTTKTWTTIDTKLNQARSSYVAGVVGTKAYLLGGWYANPNAGLVGGYFLDSIEAFDMETETAEKTEFVLPTPLRRACASVTVGDQIVVIGGLDDSIDPFKILVSQVVGFQPQSDIPWNTTWPALPTGIFAPGASYNEAKNAIYIFGGYSSGDSNSTSAYEMDLGDPPSEWTWKELPGKMQVARTFVQPVLVEPGVYGLLGGADNPPLSGDQSTVFEEYQV